MQDHKNDPWIASGARSHTVEETKRPASIHMNEFTLLANLGELIV
jgi:hypothetical protein